MKKTYFLLLLAIFAFVFVMADDTVKLLRVYKNGEVTTIPLAYIDSIDHSKYDRDSILWNDYKTSVLWSVDSTYRLSLDEVDSVVVDSVSIQQLSADIEQIKEHLQTFDGQPVDQFQDNLLSWFNNECDYVYKATLSPSKDHIVVSMKNGMDIYVSFVDTETFESYEEGTANAKPMRRSDLFDCYDVSANSVSADSVEEIINPNILYIQGRSMPSNSILQILGQSNANAEWNKLNEVIDNSPIKASLKKISKSLSFLEEDFSKYGLIIISQTHGSSRLNGNFQVEDVLQAIWWQTKRQIGIIPTITVYVNRSKCKLEEKSIDFWVIAENLCTKFRNNPVYGSYCFSGYMDNKKTNASIYGYKSSMMYFYNDDDGKQHWPGTDSLIVRFNRFVNGQTYEDAVYLRCYENGNLNLTKHEPILNKGRKQRYFSISTDDITQRSDNGNPIITGKINGYKNLKKDIRPVLFIHEGTNNFTPADENVIKVYKDKFNEVGSNDPDEEGSIKLELDYDFESAVVYGIVAGFEYEGKIYYGETKFYGELSGLDIKKTLEWGFAGDVYFGYEVTTNLKNKENQKNYQLVLYQGENPVLARPIEVKDGEDRQITKIEFGCSKSDFTLDYNNFTAEVKDLYLTIASTVSFNGQPETTIVFNDSYDLVPLNVTYDQKPDVRIKTAKIKDVSQKTGAGGLSYYSVEISLNSMIQGTFWMDYARFYVKSIVSNRYIFSGKKHSNDDSLSDGDLPTEYVELDKYGTLAGYYEIVVNGKKISGSNHLNLTSSNDQYINKIEIVEGAISSNSRPFVLSSNQSEKINVKYNVTIHDGAEQIIDNSLKEKLLKAPKLSKGNSNLREKLLLSNEWCR